MASSDRVRITDFVAALAGLYAAEDANEAARWFGAALAERDRLGAPANNRLRDDRERHLAALRSHLAPDQLDALLAEGATLDLSDVVTAIRDASARRDNSTARVAASA